MSYVIINADDFALTQGVARGIVACRETGLTMSTTAMTCVAGAQEAFAAHAARFGDGIGLHLQLTHGIPVLPPQEIPTLVTAAGHFPNRLGNTPLNPEEIAREWRAQLDRLRSWGVEPDHVDSHHNVHSNPAHREIFRVYADLAAELGVPCRSGNPRIASFLRARGLVAPDVVVYLAELGALMKALDDKRAAGPDNIVVEICCHPGFADAELARVALNQNAVAIRDVERVALSSPELRSRLKSDGWTIIRYRDLKRLQRSGQMRPTGFLQRLFQRPAPI